MASLLEVDGGYYWRCWRVASLLVYVGVWLSCLHDLPPCLRMGWSLHCGCTVAGHCVCTVAGHCVCTTSAPWLVTVLIHNREL